MESFFSDGALRIGTLYDYRSDGHGNFVGDRREGSLTFSGTATNVTAQDLANMPVLNRLIGTSGEGKIGNMTFTDCVIDLGDLYIFSASQEYSVDAHRQWAADTEAKYAACYSIHSARLFFRAISSVIRDRAKFLGFGPVHYYDSENGLNIHSPLGQLHPGQLKGGKNYSHQVEIRGFWQPLDKGAVSPFFPRVPDAIKYCSRIASAFLAARVGA